MKSSEPIRVKQCRVEMGLSQTMMSALLRAMFPDHRGRIQWIKKSDVQKFLTDHPGFKITDVYPKKPQSATA